MEQEPIEQIAGAYSTLVSQGKPDQARAYLQRFIERLPELQEYYRFVEQHSREAVGTIEEVLVENDHQKTPIFVPSRHKGTPQDHTIHVRVLDNGPPA